MTTSRCSCGKLAFATRPLAQASADQLRRKRGSLARVYQHKGSWHISSKPSKYRSTP